MVHMPSHAICAVEVHASNVLELTGELTPLLVVFIVC